MRRLLLLVGLSACLSADAPRSAIAIRNARIVPVSGPVLAHGTVVIRNGLIEAVGEKITPPADAWIVEGEGLTVYPGLIDALSTFGIPELAPPATPLAAGGRRGAAPPAATPAVTPAAPPIPAAPPARGPEDRPATTSWVHAADMLQPTDKRLETARNAGFTSAVTFPARGIFAGQGAVIDLAGERAGEMVVSPSAGQYVTMTPNGFASYPGSLMGVIAYIRQIYSDADQYQHARAIYSKHPRGTERPQYDRALEGVLDSPRILLPAIRVVEMERMIRLANELKQKPVLYGGQEAYKNPGVLKRAGVPVLVSLKWPERRRDGDPEEVDALRVYEFRERAPSTPGVLAKNGVPFAFYMDGIDQRTDFLRALKRAFDQGLSADDALRALTLTPAEFYGVADRLGSIEKGKIANLVVTKGDLFDEKAKVEYVFVDGRKFEPVVEAPPPGGPDAGRAGQAGAERPGEEPMPRNSAPVPPTPTPEPRPGEIQ